MAPAADTRRAEAGIGDCAPRCSQMFADTNNRLDMFTPKGGSDAA